MRKAAAINPAEWLKNWQIAQREARRLMRRLRQRRRLAFEPQIIE